MDYRLRLNSANDVLTDILRITYVDAQLLYHSQFVAPWGMTLRGDSGAIFHIVERGGCWLHLVNEDKPVPLASGDLVVLPNSTEHKLVDLPATQAMPMHDLLSCHNAEGAVSLSPSGSGLTTTLTSGEFRYGKVGPHPLFSLLPPLIHIKGERGQAVEWLAHLVGLIADEVENHPPGYETLLSRLFDILFIMVLRHWINTQPASQGGWLSALHDPQIARALGYIHRPPEEDWTIEKLADEINMSRSAFAARFTDLVGEPPISYLTRWRMQLAMKWLTDESLGLDAIAQMSGYQSAYAFSKTFKRLIGIAPRDYRKTRRTSVTNGH
jgi:AraC family transcriptional regulator, alkane utilization regulator